MHNVGKSMEIYSAHKDNKVVFLILIVSHCMLIYMVNNQMLKVNSQFKVIYGTSCQSESGEKVRR